MQTEGCRSTSAMKQSASRRSPCVIVRKPRPKLRANHDLRFMVERTLQGRTQERSRVLVEIDGGIRMRAQNRRWRDGADRVLEANLHRVGFAAVGHNRQYLLGLENLARRHGDR